MPLTKEQLLIPRFKVIGGIPFLNKTDATLYEIGTIITDDGIHPATNSNGDPVFITDWKEYPHIFQPLPWWSDRGLSDLPEYVILNVDLSDKGKCYKVSRWFHYSTIVSQEKSVGFHSDEGDTIGAHAVLPIDKEEYNAYINQKQQ